MFFFFFISNSQAVDVDLRKDFWNGICLAGGTSLMPGFKERVERDLSNISPAKVKVIETAQKPEVFVFMVYLRSLQRHLPWRESFLPGSEEAFWPRLERFSKCGSARLFYEIFFFCFMVEMHSRPSTRSMEA